MSERFDVFTFDEMRLVSCTCKCGTQIVFDLSRDPKLPGGECPSCGNNLQALKEVIEALAAARIAANKAKLDIRISAPAPK